MAENENKHLTPVWIVYVDGRRLDTDHEGALQRIIVDDRINGIGECTLEFDTSAVKLLDAGIFNYESEVSIHLGYKDDCEKVFSGDVTSMEVELLEYGHEQLRITCSNCLYKLKNARRSTSFEGKKLSDVLKETLDTYSLQGKIDDFGSKKEYSTEIGESDYDYLMNAARYYGKTVYAYESTVYVKDEVTIASDDIILEWGKSLISFKAEGSIKNQLSDCTFVGWDAEKCEAITGTAGIGDLKLKVGGGKSWKDNAKNAAGIWKSIIVTDDLLDNDDAKNRALAEVYNHSMCFQTGVGKCEGNYKVHPGMRVSIKYVGKKYSGEYIADRVIHTFNTSGAFITEVYVKRNMSE